MPLVAFGLAVAASLAVLFVPLASRQEACSATPSDNAAPAAPCKERVSHVTLIEEEGPSLLPVVAVPLAIAGIGFGLARTRWGRPAALTSGTLLTLFAVLTGFSIGLFYLPAAIALFMATSRLPQSRVTA